MDSELRDHLAAMEQRILQHADASEKRIMQHVDAIEKRILGYVDEKTEKVETSLLTEFHNWASPNEARARSMRESLRAFDLELDAIKERVRNLESGSTH
jgi:hypothetical protein